MDTDDIAVLRAIAAGDNFSAIARQARMAPSTISRRIEALEGALGLRLVDRRADGVQLTAQGARIASLGEGLLEAASRIAREAAALRGEGREERVVVSATEFFVAEVLAPSLPRLWAEHPGLRVTLQSQGQVVSLAHRQADIALRMARPEGASLIARKLPALRMGLFASPGFLAGRDPAAIALRDQPLLVYDDSYGDLPEQAWITRGGFGGNLALRSSSGHALLHAACHDAGIALLGAPFAQRAGLIEIAPPFPIPPRTPWLVTHRDLRRLPRIAAVHGWIMAVMHEAVREAPAANPPGRPPQAPERAAPKARPPAGARARSAGIVDKPSKSAG